MPVTQYTAQSREYLAIGIGAFFFVLALAVAFLLRRAWLNSVGQRRKEHGIAVLCTRQHQAINWVIQEINNQIVVPPGLMEELTRLHSAYPSVINGSNNREIY